VGLEPSCLSCLRDEFPVLESDVLAKGSFLLEEFLARNPGKLRFRETKADVLLHGHCHQKAFDAMPAVEKVLGMVPGLKVSTVQTSCCGMAGSFGYEAEHYEVSMKMAELSLLPSIRNSSKDTLLVADGTSCRHQIADGTGRKAVHVARVLEQALP
jgi:Fe-S oxidoreductase